MLESIVTTDTKERPAMFVGRTATAVACAVASLGLFAGSASASHAGQPATCDNGDTFTLRAAENSADFQSPAPDHVLIFEEGGVLTVLRLSVNGNLAIDRAATGRAGNAVNEVTCSFTLGLGGPAFVVTGVLTAR
jgi:hypothetical protein